MAKNATMRGRAARNTAAATVAYDAETHAASLGVEMEVMWDPDQDRLSFMIQRNGAPKGSGAQAIQRLLELADAAEIDVILDVAKSEPKLVGYYWRFGFRLIDGDLAAETEDLAKLTATRDAFLLQPKMEPVDFGVTTMFRERGAGPLTPGS